MCEIRTVAPKPLKIPCTDTTWAREMRIVAAKIIKKTCLTYESVFDTLKLKLTKNTYMINI